MSIPAEVSDSTGRGSPDLHRRAERSTDGPCSKSDGGGSPGGTGQDCFGLPGGQTERRGWPRVWRAAEYGGSAAQAVCGSWAGRGDRARPGKTARYGADLRLWVLRQLELPPPKGLASWDGASLAAALGASDDAVWRLGRCGLAPAAQGRRPIAPAALLVRQHRPTICGQACPWPEQGAADIIGL